MFAIVKCTRMSPEYKKLSEPEDVVSYLEVFPWARDMIEEHSVVDMGFTFAIICDMHAKEIPLYAEELGVTSFKFYLGYKDVDYFGRRIGLPLSWDDGTLYLGLENVAEINGVAAFHAENNQIARVLKQRLKDQGRMDLAAWDEGSPDFCEAIDVVKMAYLSKYLDCQLYEVHVSTRMGLEEVRKAQANGVKIVGETCPHYLVLNTENSGILAKANVPIRSPKENEALWRGIQDGVLTCIGSDHVPCLYDEMYTEGDIWKSLSGFPEVETILPILLSEGVNRGRLSLEQVVDICCKNPAKTFGLYPKKGVIQVGADADLVILDLKKKRFVRAKEMKTASDFSVYEGWEFTGWPIFTMVRGNIVYEDGQVVGKPGTGQYLPRKPK